MSKYNPTKIIQLITFCAWKAKETPDSSGYATLEEKIDEQRKAQNKHHNDLTAISQQYLSDLMSRCRRCVKENTKIGVKQCKLEQLLNFIGFSNWEDFDCEITYYFSRINNDTDEISETKENGITILCNTKINEAFTPYLDRIKSLFKHPTQVIVAPFKDAKEHCEKAIKQQAFVLWLITSAESALGVDLPLLKHKQVLPVYLDEKDLFKSEFSIAPPITQKDTKTGLVSAFIALMTLDTFLVKRKVTTSAPVVNAGQRIDIGVNKGTVIQTMNITDATNLSFGGNINIHTGK